MPWRLLSYSNNDHPDGYSNDYCCTYRDDLRCYDFLEILYVSKINKIKVSISTRRFHFSSTRYGKAALVDARADSTYECRLCGAPMEHEEVWLRDEVVHPFLFLASSRIAAIVIDPLLIQTSVNFKITSYPLCEGICYFSIAYVWYMLCCYCICMLERTGAFAVCYSLANYMFLQLFCSSLRVLIA